MSLLKSQMKYRISVTQAVLMGLQGRDKSLYGAFLKGERYGESQ